MHQTLKLADTWALGMACGAARKALESALAAPSTSQQTLAHYERGYGVALSDAEEAIDEECRERVVTASDCIEIIRNLVSAPTIKQSLTVAERLAVFDAADKAMKRNPNLSWREAIVSEVEAAHGIKGGE